MGEREKEIMPKSIQIRPHAQRQLKERRIPEELVRKVLRHPGQVVDSYSHRKVAQDIVEYKGGKILEVRNANQLR